MNANVLDFLLSFQICPVCASFPGGDPNRVTDDLGAHLNMEHRNTREHVCLLPSLFKFVQRSPLSTVVYQFSSVAYVLFCLKYWPLSFTLSVQYVCQWFILKSLQNMCFLGLLAAVIV